VRYGQNVSPSHRSSPKHTFLIVGLLVVAVAMAACSSGGASADLAKVVADAADRTGSSSARVVMDMTLESSAASEAIQVTTSGEVAEGGSAADLTMQVAGGSQARTLGLRLVDGSFYVQTPGTDEWQRFDASALSGQQGFGASNPTTGLDYLRGASSSIDELGAETVRGVETTRYHAVVDVAKTAEQLSGDARQRVEALSQLGVDELPTDVWIDDEGRVRREFFTMHVGQGDQVVSIGMTMELFDFGIPVDVQPPPDDQVREGDPSALGFPG